MDQLNNQLVLKDSKFEKEQGSFSSKFSFKS